MNLFAWLCGCDSPHRDESAQYITTADCASNGYPEKKPICTEQPKSASTVVEAPKANGKAVNGYQSNGVPPLQNGHIENKKSPKANESQADESFSVPDFELIRTNVQGYRQLVQQVKAVMTDRQARLERLIELQQVPNEVDEDARAARGKIIVIVKNNLTTFEKLLTNATDESQQIADLTGFWGLVHKELIDVQKACQRVEESRLSGWKALPRPLTPPPSTPPTTASSRATRAPLKSGSQTPGRTPKSNPNLRAFMAQKRREMKSSEQLAADT